MRTASRLLAQLHSARTALWPSQLAAGCVNVAVPNAASVAVTGSLDKSSGRCLLLCSSQASHFQQPAAGLHSSCSCSSSKDDQNIALNGIRQDVPPARSPSSGNSYSVNPLSLDQLLQNAPLAANSSSNPSSNESSTEQQQQQLEMSEQVLSELFDAELEQRLLSAAATARARTTVATLQRDAFPASHSTADQQPSSTAEPSMTEEQQGEHSAHRLQLQPAPQQQRYQPGVTPMLPQTPSWAQQQHQVTTGHSRSGSGSSLPRISSWNPLVNTDPWAPIPGPAYARQRLSSQLQQLLEQAGVTSEQAAAALAQAAAVTPAADKTAASKSSSALRRPRHWQSYMEDDYMAVLNRLQKQQLVSLLEDCQAPTYGAKHLLLNRLVLLLREQAVGTNGNITDSSTAAVGQSSFHMQDARSGREAAVTNAAELQASAAKDNVGSSLDSMQKQGKHKAKQLQMHQEVQQQQGDSRWAQIRADTLTRAELRDAIADVHEICNWLMAARAQDVCVIDVRGRAGRYEQLIIATGVSQRHAHACAEAVSYQLLEKAKQYLAQQLLPAEPQDDELVGQTLQAVQQQQQEILSGKTVQQQHNTTTANEAKFAGGVDIEQWLPSLPVLGDSSSDWAVLDTGTVAVHVLTQRARRYYDLEGFWGEHGKFIKWLKSDKRVETKDTIGREIANGGSEMQLSSV